MAHKLSSLTILAPQIPSAFIQSFVRLYVWNVGNHLMTKKTKPRELQRYHPCDLRLWSGGRDLDPPTYKLSVKYFCVSL